MDRNPMQRRGNNVPLKQKPIHNADTVQDDEYEDYEGYDDVWPSRMPGSVRRYEHPADVQTRERRTDSASHTGRSGYTRADVQTLSSLASRSNRGEELRSQSTIPPRRSATQTSIPAMPAVQAQRRRPVQTDDIDVSDISSPRTEALRRSGQKRRLHWLVFVGGAMLIMVVGWILLSTFASWWQVTLDDWHYGRPRTYQVDQVVGHNDSPSNPSHFIALNLNSHIEIIEFPGGDATKAKVYIGPTLIGPGQDLAPVTLDFKDLTGNGKLDMIVDVGGSHFVFINDNGTFRPARPSDNIQQ